MSANLGEQTTLGYSRVAATAHVDTTIVWQFANPTYDFIITGLMVVVTTAAGGNCGLTLATVAGTSLAVATINTSAAYTNILAVPTAANAYRSAGTTTAQQYTLTMNTSQAAAAYTWWIFGSLVHN
jgi:hypothetical protein